MNGLKLFVEEPTFELEYIVEEKNPKAPSTMFIRGQYLMAEKKNKNGRVYSLQEMAKEVERYTTEMVAMGRSLGELNHPTSVEINPERACHMITEMKQDGNIFYGKSKILGTPMGLIVRTLINEGVKLGISSRALGKLNPEDGVNKVSGFRFICCDVVHDPSVETAFVDGILESKEYVLKCDGSVCELYDQFENKLETLPKHNADQYLKEHIIKFLESIKNKV